MGARAQERGCCLWPPPPPSQHASSPALPPSYTSVSPSVPLRLHFLCPLIAPCPQLPSPCGSPTLSVTPYLCLPLLYSVTPSPPRLCPLSSLAPLALDGTAGAPRGCLGLPISPFPIVWTNSYPVSSAETWVDVFKRNSLGSKGKTNPNKATHHLETALVTKAGPSALTVLGPGCRDPS